MAQFLRACLQQAARWARVISGLGLVFLSVRLAWLASADALNAAGSSAREGLGQADAIDKPSPAPTDAASVEESTPKLPGGKSTHRPDLKELRGLAGGEPDAAQTFEKASTKITSRGIVVDVGPERSEVFIGGRQVGHTPYVGQFLCADGDVVRIEILPPRGAPVRRSAICRGTTIVQEE